MSWNKTALYRLYSKLYTLSHSLGGNESNCFY